MKCILLFLSLVCSLSVSAQYCSEVWSPDNGDGTYTNPVINADYSDPDVVAIGDDYYLTASSFNCIPGRDASCHRHLRYRLDGRYFSSGEYGTAYFLY